ncbi:M56 family metallopeptidase [Polaribacter sp. SA4-12]|uniref:M56 family metallopeptidase n=1 Tax=Polaribacter sp. SA4-12 TaxID=1312072 RepID=UPI000B3CED1C|nr:M56 family metallopeptidase [Polaribacter sp. SA4-12]ARV16466.1 BlaR1 peptidase M56 [Polaribacter sp. SA4-12]
MINYILQVILFQVLFLAIYDFFLSKETFFTKNRWYLISTPVLSFILPFIKIPTFQKAVPQEFIINLPEIVLSPDKVIQEVIQETSFYQSINYLDILFWLGVSLFSMLFLVKLYKIANLIRKYEVYKKAGYILVLIPNQTKAFSFFNFIFLGKEIRESQQAQIIEHELVHSKQKHSLDLLFFEFLKIMMWFNPMIFMYQKRITLVHEYISDEVAAKSETKEIYINNLLSNFFQVENIAFVNQFYKQTFIKKRIIMMKKTQSKKMNQLKYLVLIPVLASMLFYTSCSESTTSEVLVKKQIETLFRLKDGKLVGKEGDKETYLDSYIGLESPLNAIEISIDDLSKEEMQEFVEIDAKFKERLNEKSKFSKIWSFKFYKMPNGRNASAMIFNIDKYREKVKTKNDNTTTETEEVSFMSIDKAPTFPGCESGDKDCFSKMVYKHFSREFDADLPNQLGLDAGKKRVFIAFKINKEGNVVDVKARAPHPKIKTEVLKVMNALPKMIPGEDEGKKVDVKYSIPLTLLVE